MKEKTNKQKILSLSIVCGNEISSNKQISNGINK